MKSIAFRRHALVAALAAMTVSPILAAQESTDRRNASGSRRAAQSDKAKAADAAKAGAEQKYPGATRSAPRGAASPKAGKALQSMIKLEAEGKHAEARGAADAMLADASYSAYERATAAHIAANAAVGAKDYDAALRYSQQALELDALANNDHFDLMSLKAQLQLNAKDYSGALQTVEQLRRETGAVLPVHLAIQGNSLYRLERYADAAAVLREAVAAMPDRSDLKALLADAYLRSGNAAEAAKLTATVASANPADATAQLNLAVTYLQAGQSDRAIEVLERMRTAGQLTEDGYRQLFSAYARLEGKEAETIAVIEDGLAKGVLKPDYNVYLALGQSYYFTDETDKAIAAYAKAAPLAPNGETWLNLAKIYRNAQRNSEAKQAAQQALSKGVKNRADAEKLLALPGK